MSADNILFRCSGNGNIMTEAKSKTEIIGETCKSYLLEVFIKDKYSRTKEITSRYLEKGIGVEEDSITLYSKFSKQMFQKNEVRLTNDFISGTPDIYKGPSIEQADEIHDVKSSWDIWTFHKAKNSALNKMYYWQGQGYMALTGAKIFKLAYCLVNTPETLIYQQMKSIQYKTGIMDENHPDIVKAFEEIRNNSIYDDVPINERCHVIEIERNDEDIEKLYQRVRDCRTWMNENLYK